MSLTQKTTFASFLAAQCLVASLAGAPQAQAQTSSIPDYFFKEWTVSKNCAEAHSGLVANVVSGLKFKITRDTTADGSYVFQAEDSATQKWAANWNGIKLEYRPGTPMTTVPADFECIPGQESSSPLFAMSGYAQASEPYYEQQHWYGLATIHGQQEHVLVFARNAKGPSSAIIVLESVNAPSTVKLDDNGAITSED
jgi:hypothetical protein